MAPSSQSQRALWFILPAHGASHIIKCIIREVKHDVYGKRQTAKMKLLPSAFSTLYSGINTFVLAVNSTRQFSIFV